MNTSRFWNLQVTENSNFNNKSTLTKSILRDNNTYGFFDNEVFLLLQNNDNNRKKVVEFILNKYWPESIQKELLIQLDLENLYSLKRKRNNNFVRDVLSNYRYKCAICGFTGLFNNTPFGIDAAHIHWHAYGGPDTIDNGIALCKLHHWAFDKGAITINPDSLVVKVSPKFVAQDTISIRLIEDFDSLIARSYKDIAPNNSYLEWHNENIYIF